MSESQGSRPAAIFPFPFPQAVAANESAAREALAVVDAATPARGSSTPAWAAWSATAGGADQAGATLRSALARVTGGISPVSLLAARNDWLAHLAMAPDRQQALGAHAADLLARLTAWAASGGTVPAPLQPAARDPRFRHPGWQQWPFLMWQQAFLATESWWHEATRAVPGVTRHHGDLVEFFARQLLDTFSPSNVPWLNPEVIEATLRQGGANLLQGWHNRIDDFGRQARGEAPAGAERFQVGVDLAVTPGRVVLRNRLMELIQYAPATATVAAEPLLLVPAWIMKYYILDLSPANSLIRHLVEHGHTVFVISWKNPDEGDRDLGMDDYLELGLQAALDAVASIVPGRRIHAAGYCLGGTLLSLGAAALARDGDTRLASLTLLAAQTDFTEPGELGLFVDESQLAFLGDLMQRQGYLSADQMAGTFQLMRSIDLVWSRIVHEYLLGERPALNDLMAWNADGTRMPCRMHAEYLERMFLHNDLAAGRYPVRGRPVALADLRLPMFVVGTLTDHVAPWRSVYKLHLLTDAELSFVLTSGGHNAGVVNPPAGSHHSYRLAVRPLDGGYRDPEQYLSAAEPHQGSWWTAWVEWLAQRRGEQVAPPPMGSERYPVLADAPGSYVLQR